MIIHWLNPTRAIEMSKPVMDFYQTEWCPYCRRVKKVLEELGVPYCSIRVPNLKFMRQELKKVSGQTGIPTLIDGDVIITDDDDAIISYLKRQYGGQQKVNG
jgi:glutathione S-transferase